MKHNDRLTDVFKEERWIPLKLNAEIPVEEDENLTLLPYAYG